MEFRALTNKPDKLCPLRSVTFPDKVFAPDVAVACEPLEPLNRQTATVINIAQVDITLRFIGFIIGSP